MRREGRERPKVGGAGADGGAGGRGQQGGAAARLPEVGGALVHVGDGVVVLALELVGVELRLRRNGGGNASKRGRSHGARRRGSGGGEEGGAARAPRESRLREKGEAPGAGGGAGGASPAVEAGAWGAERQAGRRAGGGGVGAHGQRQRRSSGPRRRRANPSRDPCWTGVEGPRLSGACGGARLAPAARRGGRPTRPAAHAATGGRLHARGGAAASRRGCAPLP